MFIFESHKTNYYCKQNWLKENVNHSFTTQTKEQLTTKKSQKKAIKQLNIPLKIEIY
tara:strand:+ start:2041 stop:2211 length:171 start_codon:yes stop_codon:yes gene_type:complete